MHDIVGTPAKMMGSLGGGRKSTSNMAIASHRIGWRESWRLVDRYWQYWHGYRGFQTVHAISWLASFFIHVFAPVLAKAATVGA
jgi:hypothetical protein